MHSLVHGSLAGKRISSGSHSCHRPPLTARRTRRRQRFIRTPFSAFAQMNTLCILNPTTSVKWVSRTYYLLITPFCLLPTIEYHTHHSCGYSSDSCSNSSCSTTPNCTIFTKFYQDDCRPGDRTKAKPSGNPGRRPVVYTQTNSSIVMKNEAEPRKEE